MAWQGERVVWSSPGLGRISLILPYDSAGQQKKVLFSAAIHLAAIMTASDMLIPDLNVTQVQQVWNFLEAQLNLAPGWLPSQAGQVQLLLEKQQHIN
ncbi:hypothetical protein MMC29_000015 [Sticta canariensis]|nr:hypothetical protein [Sticta canariensis]